MIGKICRVCGQIKPESEYYTHSNGKGLYRQCKACIAKKSLEHYKSNRAQIQTSRRARKYSNRRSAWASSTRTSHKHSGHAVNISLQELTAAANMADTCALCSVPLKWDREPGDRRLYPNSPSMDRMDNGGELSAHNTMIICHRCNSTKGPRTLAEFVHYCKAIVNKCTHSFPATVSELIKSRPELTSTSQCDISNQDLQNKEI